MSTINLRSADASKKSTDFLKVVTGKIPDTKELPIKYSISESGDSNNKFETKVIFKKSDITEEFIKQADGALLNKNFIYRSFNVLVPTTINTDFFNYRFENKENADQNRISTFTRLLVNKKITQEFQIAPYYKYLPDIFESGQTNQTIGINRDYDALLTNNENAANRIMNTDYKFNKLYFSAAATNKINEYNKKALNNADVFLPYYVRLTIPTGKLLPNLFSKHYERKSKNNLFRALVYQKEFINTKNIIYNNTDNSFFNVPTAFQTKGNVSSDIFKLDFLKRTLSTETYTEFEKRLKQYEIFGINENQDLLTPDWTSGEFNIKEFIAKNNKSVAWNDGGTTYEIVMLKIEKYIGSSNTPIQEIYLGFDDKSPNNIEFIDNQVFIGKTYRYEIKAIIASYDIAYTYSKSTNDREIIYVMNQEPSQTFLEIPWFSFFNNTFGTGLAVPDAEFLTENNKPNRIRALISSNTANTAPKPINTKDEEYFRKVIDTTGKILFDNENFDYCQVYKLTKEPKMLSDFNGFEYKKLLKNQIFVDEISNNQDFYYIFQNKTNNGKVSNPSVIYKVRLNLNDYGFEPIIQIFDIRTPTEILSDFYKKQNFVRKVLKIEPSYYQKLVKEVGIPGTYKFSDITLNTTSFNEAYTPYSGIWENANDNSNYKIRITSVSTGRKVDIKLNFKYRIINKAK